MTATLLGTSAVPADAAAPKPTTYHVDCSAKKAGNGATSPWTSLKSVSAHTFHAGDHVLFKRGTTCKGRFAPRGSGSAGKPIVIGAYGSAKRARPVIAGGGTPTATGAVTLRNQHDITLQDLHVTNRSKSSTTTAYRAGVLVKNDNAGMLRGVTLQRLTVDNVTSRLLYSKKYDARDWGGIIVHTSKHGGGDGFEGLQIVHNSLSGVGRTGISTSNREYPAGLDHAVRIAYNTVSKSRGDGMIQRGSANSRIDHNLLKNNSNMWPCAGCKAVKGMGANTGLWPTMSRDLMIDHNNIYGTHVGHGDGMGLDLDIGAERTTVEYNYIHDNLGGGMQFCGSLSSTVRFNILENNQRGAFVFIGSVPARSTSIYNNTVYASKAAKSRMVWYHNGPKGSGVSFKNNLLYNYGTGSYMWPTKPTTAANTLVGVHTTARPHDSRTSRKDPGLKSPGHGGNSFGSLGGYRLKHPSSMQRGVAIPASVKVDFFGKRIDAKRPPRGAAG